MKSYKTKDLKIGSQVFEKGLFSKFLGTVSFINWEEEYFIYIGENRKCEVGFEYLSKYSFYKIQNKFELFYNKCLI